jgi:hypothetical protein
MFILVLIQAIVFVACLIVKFNYWSKIPNPRITLLFTSFLKRYSSYAIYNSTSTESKIFKKKSNRVNLFYWILVAVVFAFYFIFILETGRTLAYFE